MKLDRKQDMEGILFSIVRALTSVALKVCWCPSARD